MKKLWSYIAMFFIGLSAGLVAMYKLTGDQIEINIKKIKTKRGSSDISIPIHVDKPEKRPKRTKAERKQDRVIKRNQKKRDKDNKRLEDGTE